MIRKGLFLVCALLIPALLLAAKPSKSKGKNKKKAKTEQTDTASVKKTSDYDKLFKGKKCQTVKGLVTIHKVDGEKLYFELPMSIFGREMLLGSTVSETSNNDHGVVGYKAKDPLHVTFAKEGHKSVQLCLVNDIYSGDGKDKGIDEAVRRSSIPGIYRAFKIEAYNADSTAVVIDVTNLFMEDNDDLTPFDPYSTFGYKPFSRTTSFQKSNSHLGDIKAFEDNVTVKSYLSYTTTVTYSNGPMIGKIEDKRAFTALVTRTLLLLPEKEMRPRIADPRMNIFVTGKARFSSNMNRGTLPVYYARHWRVEPKDVEAYKRGELVEPVKPIVFYLDTNLPEAWKPYAREGIEQWNDAFEKIGFKNVVQVRDYPTPEEDPEFDPDNLKYSCIRYAPLAFQNAMGPSWDDPRTGEIITASVMVYHDIVKLLNRWRFLQTAAADPNVRTVNIPDSIMGSALRYVLSHEVGHCLGFMHNMASSAAIPVDSLRSPSFTQKYGTTPSIMDYARNNYIAQRGDFERGVRMVPPLVGVYDIHAINWGYRIFEKTRDAEEELPLLNELLAAKRDDPMYEFGAQQIFLTLDPTDQSEDLGNDHIKAGNYGIENCKYMIANLCDWFAEENRDYKNIQSMYAAVIGQYTRYLMHVMPYLGGVEYKDLVQDGRPLRALSYIPAERQKQAMKWLVDQVLTARAWLLPQELMDKLGQPSTILDNAASGVAGKIFSPATLGSIYQGERSGQKGIYRVDTYLNDAYNTVFASAVRGGSLTVEEMNLQGAAVAALLKNSGLTGPSGTALQLGKGLADDGSALLAQLADEALPPFVCNHPECRHDHASAGEISYYRHDMKGPSLSAQVGQPLYAATLRRVLSLYKQRRGSGDARTRDFYEFQILKIESAFKNAKL